MMRDPSEIGPLYEWWLAASKFYMKHQTLRGFDRPISTEPECGYFRRRFRRDAPWVPARIWLHQSTDPETGELTDDERLMCVVDGKLRDPHEEWTYLCGQPISRQEFLFMCANAKWAEQYLPSDPAVRPREKVDFLTAPLPTFKSRGRKK